VTLLWTGLLVVLLAVPALIAIYWWSRRRRRPAAARYSSLALVRAAGPSRRRWRRHLPFALFAASIAVLAVALTRPVVVLSVPTNQTTIVLAMDVSGSMCSSDISPTRLKAAEDAAVAFVDSQASGTQIGIVAFSGFAAVIQPPTTDRTVLEDAIRSLTTGRRTAIGSGIEASIDAIAEVDPNVARTTTDNRPGTAPTPILPGAYAPDIVVLLTDGASNAGPDPLDGAQQAADRGLRVYTIGFGTADGGQMDPVCRTQFMGREPGANDPNGGFGGGFNGGGFNGGGGNPNALRRGIDEATLRKIAELTGGTYSPAESAGALTQVFADLPTTLITKHEPVEITFAFVALGGLLAGVALLLSRAWRPLP
jgi:Ca-activated chloride channel homolog